MNENRLRRMVGWIAVVALVAVLAGCTGSEEVSGPTADNVVEPPPGGTLVPFTPKPIQVGPGSGGNLTWTEDGTVISPNTNGELRDDFVWRTDYLTAKIGTDTVNVEKVQMTIVYPPGTGSQIVVQLTGKNGHLSWGKNGMPFKLCDSRTSGCRDNGIPAELTEVLVGGTFKVWRTIGGTEETATEIGFKPMLSAYCQ